MATDDPNAVQIPMTGMGLYRCNRYEQSFECRKHVETVNRLTAAAFNLLTKHRLGAISEADVRWMEAELKSIAGPETNSQSDWVSVPCTSPSCRGLKTGNPFPAVCKKGHEHHAVCNECFCK